MVAPNHFQPIPQAENFDICTLSNIGVTSGAGYCALHKDGNG
jgi:hypothetical protein